ncbi:hypothetical protein ACLBXM_07385 [Xanthobacteraceae bacterium A53D]
MAFSHASLAHADPGGFPIVDAGLVIPAASCTPSFEDCLVDTGAAASSPALQSSLPPGGQAHESAYAAGQGEAADWADWSQPIEPDPLDPRSHPHPPALIGALERRGLTAALLYPDAGCDWRLILDLAGRWPQRLRAILPLTRLEVPAQVATLTRHGLAGFSVSASLCRRDGAIWRSLLLRLSAHGLHLHLQAPAAQWAGLLPLVLGYGVPVRVDVPTDARDLAAACGVLMAHAGHPDLWVGFAPSAVRDHAHDGLMDRLLAIAGSDRLIWCGGKSQMADLPDDSLPALLDLLPPGDVRRKICGGNAHWLAFATEDSFDPAA